MNVYQFKPKPTPRRGVPLSVQPWLPAVLVLAGALILFLLGLGFSMTVGLVAVLIVLIGAALNGGSSHR